MATKKTPAKKTVTPKAIPTVEYYYSRDSEDLLEAIDNGSHPSLTDAVKDAQAMHLDSGDKQSTLYLYKVERLPVKKITTTVTITD